MDIPRKSAARQRRIRLVIYIFLGVIGAVTITWGLSRLKPAAPSVDGGTVWRDTVKRGPMDLQVRGLGTLVPYEIQYVPAITNGRVAKRLALAGTMVKADTVLMVLSNPDLEQQTLNADWAEKQAESDYNSLKQQLTNQVYDQRAVAATAKSDSLQATLQADRDEQMAKLGLGPQLTADLSKAKADSEAVRSQIEADKVGVLQRSVDAQLVASQAKIEQLKALYQLQKNQLESLQVRAGIDGVLEELDVEVGQQVTPGTLMAKVADPNKLKAELKIAETQAKDVQLGQTADIDTHNGVVPGHVIRIDPSVQNGTRTVDVKLDGPPPPGAVPDLSVDGTVEIQHLDNVLYVGRPAFGQEDSTVSLFKVSPDGKDALHVQVKLGRISVTEVEILQGLNVGDTVILSDMQRWDGFDRIRLE
ncbi:MAG TPA: efflux RND transporter periplasmic adaptor subunit [Terriglobia bacterium]|jgi:HlyD family secretion protein|nr:efflux RND transporter periplasmic adaptor subunit [Terriglobia bacterium]